MTALRHFLTRHPALSYFILTFAISWGGVFAVIAPVGFPGSTAQNEFYMALLALEAGPLLAGVLLTALIEGRAGLRAWWQWRVGVHWYVRALLAVPLLVAPTLFVLSIFSLSFLPAIVTAEDKPALLLAGLMAGLMGGIFEEPGWTGFAVPVLRRRHGVLATGLIVGVLWGAWHVLLTLWASGDAAGLFAWELFLPPLIFYVGVLPAFRVLMVWVYDRTRSLPVAMVMHMSLTACTIFILAPQATGMALAIYYVVFTVLLWGILVMAAVDNGGFLVQYPLPPTMRGERG